MAKAGVVLVSKFIIPGSKKFSGYIDYIDRDDAVRNEFSEKWNGYVDYMDNPEKTTELFTANSDSLTLEEKQHYKAEFINAQKENNLMWQTVISFDNDWLEEMGLFDKSTNTLDVDKCKEITRNSMKKMLKAENIDDSSIWMASVHYNTDNIHIHIATTEPGTSNRKVMDDGTKRGKWKQSTLNMGKAAVVNGIMQQQEENLLINNVMKKQIVQSKRERNLHHDTELRSKFLSIYENLPSNKNYWNYNSTKLGNRNRMELDELSKMYIEKYHKDEYEEFKNAVKVQQDKYTKAYGQGNKTVNNYAANKEKELYTRLGNAILSEMKDYDKELRQVRSTEKIDTQYSSYKLKSEIHNKDYHNKDIESNLNLIGKSLKKLNDSFRKDIQSVKNQMQHEQFEYEAEMKKKGYDIEL